MLRGISGIVRPYATRAKSGRRDRYSPGRTKKQRSVRGGTSVSSQRWLQRQQKDVYVRKAHQDGLPSRAAYKLAQIDDKYKVLAPDSVVVELGSYPGGMTKVILDRVKMSERGLLVAVDLVPVPEPEQTSGVVYIEGNIESRRVQRRVIAALPEGTATVVVSDMAPKATGNKSLDRDAALELSQTAFEFARPILANGANFVVKVLRGGGTPGYFKELEREFERVERFKPDASRSNSSEMFFVCLGFKGSA